MKKRINYFIKTIFVLTMLFTQIPVNVFALTEEQVKNENEIKGIIYNPQSNTVGNSAVINDYYYKNGTSYSNQGDVEIKKTVKQEGPEGRYRVTFEARGIHAKKGTTSVSPVYVVVVLDASNSMNNPNIEKWNNAVKGVKDFSSQLLKKENVPDAQIALVKFAGRTINENWSDAEVKREFKNEDFSTTNIGGLTVNNGGATNLGEGLRYAYNLLYNHAPANASKYVVVLGDGVPTLYTKENGKSDTTSESNYATRYDTKSHEYATTWANKIKNKNDLNATIISVGYELSSIENSKDRRMAPIVLKEISSGDNFYVDTAMDNVVSEVKNITSTIETEFYPGTDLEIYDNLGEQFNFVSGDKTLKLDKITNKWQTVGSFLIDINKTVDTDWYRTNASFTWSYTDYNGNKTPNYTCTDDPEVFWENKYDYTVNYYKDEITNTSDNKHFIDGYTDKANNKEVIKLTEDQKIAEIPEGYYLEGMYDKYDNKITSLTIDKTKENIINVLYKIKKFKYQVNYYYAHLNNQYGQPEKTVELKDIPYGTEVTTASHLLKQNEIKIGYSLDENNTKTSTKYTIKDDKVIIDIYYKRNSYSYIVNYHFNNNLDTNLTNNKNIAIFGSTIYANQNYLEDVNSQGLLDKNFADNTNYFLEPGNLSNISNKLIGNDPLQNVLNIYYVSTNFNLENIKKESNIEKITDSKTPITYTINYTSSINNIRKDDEITIIIIDKLPFEIDEENENTNLNNGIYNKDDKTITWTFTEKATNFTKLYNIVKNFKYTVVYKDFAEISSTSNNKLKNTVIGTTSVNNISTPGVIAEEEVEVEIKGKVIVNYVNKDGIKLTDTIVLEELVGSDYETTKKIFNKYSFIEVKGKTIGKIIDGVIEITYIYDLTPLPPKTGVTSNNNNSTSSTIYLLSLLVLIVFTKKTEVKN